jgi:hypothetical protein
MKNERIAKELRILVWPVLFPTSFSDFRKGFELTIQSETPLLCAKRALAREYNILGDIHIVLSTVGH